MAFARRGGLLLENAELYGTISRERQRLQVVFEQSPEGIILVEAGSGNVVLANQAAHTLLDAPLPAGAPLEPEVLARFRRDDGTVCPIDDIPLMQALRGVPQIGIEIGIEQHDGRRVPVLFNSVPLHDAQGELQGALALFQDLSSFREVERLKSDFVAMVSHELRTPLTAIQGCTQSLLSGQAGLDTQRTREFLEIINAQSVRLHDLIDNLLNISQVEAGALQLRRTAVQPSRLVRSLARQVGEQFPQYRLEVEIADPLPAISADPYRLEQVLLNLLDNARKFSPPDGLIMLRVEQRPDALCFSVRDQGPGIPAEDRARVFERFYQSTPPPREMSRGTGLGLAICKALVEAHGGKIWIDEHVTNGARICFTIPLQRVAAPAGEHTRLATVVRTAHETAHILVVDDEPVMRQMLEGSLRNAGYVADSVPEGLAALEYLASEQPDLVVLDLMLPGQDGLAILQQIRDWSQVLVLILTAAPEPQTSVRGLQLGADDYMTKPFNMDELLARIEALLRRRRQTTTQQLPAVLQRGPLMLDLARRSVQVDDTPVDLTPTEFRLLAVLARHPGQVLTHAQLLQQVWGPAYGGESQYLWVHIGRLRQKIEADPKAPRLILTERGVGYRFAAE
jgi:two-component system KDP operon response regulator KdpE